MERTKPKPANKRYVKPFTEEVRRAYQSFQDTLKKHAGRRIENVQIQRIFSEVYADIELINKYIPSFLASRNASDIYFYLSDRKYLDFAQPKENIPIPTNQAEATALNDRYKFAELVFKHKYLPCLILNGKKSPLKVPGGIPYQIGNRYFVNKSNVKIELNLSQLADYQ